jgi:hypothetical protein
MQKVKFIKDFGKFRKGDRKELRNNQAADLIQGGYCVLVYNPLPSPIAETKKTTEMRPRKQSRGYRVK